MPASSRTVRVFISSTFRDMHGEREELVKRVFPSFASCARSGALVGPRSTSAGALPKSRPSGARCCPSAWRRSTAAGRISSGCWANATAGCPTRSLRNWSTSSPGSPSIAGRASPSWRSSTACCETRRWTTGRASTCERRPTWTGFRPTSGLTSWKRTQRPVPSWPRSRSGFAQAAWPSVTIPIRRGLASWCSAT